MRLSLNWLRELIDFNLDVTDLAHRLTMLGLEIEAIERPTGQIQNVVVGKILSIDPHPDADKLVVCRTSTGTSETLQIVCGAKNMRVGDLVPTALVGATLPGGFQIAKRKMRGVESHGMMCSAEELGLGDDQSGLLILDPSYPLGADVVPLLGLDDTILELEITPNRGDWASMLGVARELSALLNKPYRTPEFALHETETSARQLSSVTIEAPDLCPRYIGRVITNVKVGPSPTWMARRLLAAGQQPINNIVDITNYVLLELGHPLHAFDYDKLTENRIVVRAAKQNETLRTLDGQERSLKSGMLVIADAARPVALAGIMGGQDSEVGESTTTIFLESAYFLPKSVRATARDLALVTEASTHFQRGADPEMARYAIDRAAAFMQTLAGGSVAQGMLDEYPQPLTRSDVTLRYARTAALLGADVPHETQRQVLHKLGCTPVSQTPVSCTVRPPSWRHDVTQEADLIEEIARLYSYDNIPSTLPRVRKSDHVLAPEEAFLSDLRRFLVGQGYSEFRSMAFSSRNELSRTRLDSLSAKTVDVENPLSENHSTMRGTLIPAMLNIASTNVKHGKLDILGFEIGATYSLNPDNILPRQHTHLAVLMSGFDASKHWSRPQRRLDIFDIKGAAETILEFFGRGPVSAFLPMSFGPFRETHSVALSVQGDTLGWLGEVDPGLLSTLDIDQPVYVLEMILDPLLDSGRSAHKFHEISVFPPALRDLALLVDANVPAGEIQKLAAMNGTELLAQVNIFDVYTGKQVPQGKKSIALSLVFQSDTKTLTDAQTQSAVDSILTALKEQFNVELR